MPEAFRLPDTSYRSSNICRKLSVHSKEELIARFLLRKKTFLSIAYIIFGSYYRQSEFSCLIILTGVRTAPLPRTTLVKTTEMLDLVCACIEVDNQQLAATSHREFWHAYQSDINVTTGHDLSLLWDVTITINAAGRFFEWVLYEFRVLFHLEARLFVCCGTDHAMGSFTVHELAPNAQSSNSNPIYFVIKKLAT
jgi:hypothetical protein